MSEDSIRRQHGLNEDEIALVKKLRESKHKEDKVNVMNVLGQTLSISQLQEATLRGEVVIDKFLTLTYPLNDTRTPDSLRALYLRQEEMMMEHVKEDEVIPSSPAKRQDDNATSLGRLKELSDDEVTTFSKANRQFLNSVYKDTGVFAE